MKEPRITDLLTPILDSLDLELEAVDLIPAGKRKLLRIVVDGDGAAGHGPNLDDIAEATKAISAALDSADVTGASPYTLEVSSRGIGRALELPRHWRRNRGRLVAVTTTAGDRLTGRIRSSTEDSVVVEVDGQPRTWAYSEVAKAQVQVELNRSLLDDERDDELDDEEEES
ncbi:MAG TPA: ribosome maturation factor RimP [Propionibacteriaceae bacterium]